MPTPTTRKFAVVKESGDDLSKSIPEAEYDENVHELIGWLETEELPTDEIPPNEG